MQILLSRTQAGPGRTVKQEHEEISRNHVQAFIPGLCISEPQLEVGSWYFGWNHQRIGHISRLTLYPWALRRGMHCI